MVLCAANADRSVVEVRVVCTGCVQEGCACLFPAMLLSRRSCCRVCCRCCCHCQFVDPPASAAVGERLIVSELPGEPEAEVNPAKKNNAWTACVPLLKTNGDRVATFNGHVLRAQHSGEPCIAPSVADGPIS